MMTANRTIQGFTLVEAVVVVGLLLLIVGGLVTVLLTGQASYLSADAYVQVQQEARRALDSVVRELRESGTVSCGTAAVTASCTGTQLNFQVARNYDPTGGAIVWGSDNADNEYVHYAVVAAADGTSQLIRYRDAAAAGAPPGTCTPPACRVLANYVDPATTVFAWDAAAANRTVTITLEIEYQNARLPGRSQTTGPLTSRVRLRNA